MASPLSGAQEPWTTYRISTRGSPGHDLHWWPVQSAANSLSGNQSPKPDSFVVVFWSSVLGMASFGHDSRTVRFPSGTGQPWWWEKSGGLRLRRRIIEYPHSACVALIASRKLIRSSLDVVVVASSHLKSSWGFLPATVKRSASGETLIFELRSQGSGHRLR